MPDSAPGCDYKESTFPELAPDVRGMHNALGSLEQSMFEMLPRVTGANGYTATSSRPTYTWSADVCKLYANCGPGDISCLPNHAAI